MGMKLPKELLFYKLYWTNLQKLRIQVNQLYSDVIPNIKERTSKY